MKGSSRETGRLSRRGKRVLCSSELPERFWAPPGASSLSDPDSSIPGNKAVWSESWPSADVHLVSLSRMMGAVPSFSPCAFMGWYLIKHKDNCLSSCSDIGLDGLRNTTIIFRIVGATPRFELGTSWLQKSALQCAPTLVAWNQLHLFLNVM